MAAALWSGLTSADVLRTCRTTTNGVGLDQTMWIIWPFRKKNFGSAASIREDFAEFIEPHVGKYAIQDEKCLPHAKSEIFNSICIAAHEGGAGREICKTLAFELTFFQKDVGKRSLHPLGMDIDSLRMSRLSTAEISRIYVTNPAEKQKYDRFKYRQDREWDRLKVILAGVSNDES